MSTLKVSNIQHSSAASAAIALDANGQATLNGLAYPTSGSLSGRNRIINGDMRIDQRNAGASVTLTASGPYTVDRFRGFEDSDGVMTAQQDSSVPSGQGFSNSLKFTTTTADSSLSALQYAGLQQTVEGFNTSDFQFGTASAKTIVLSFWVRSSLTGAFGGACLNESQNRSYPFTYSIFSADTWEYKTVVIPGDTTGTWSTTNGRGLQLNWGLGVGSTYSGTAGSWSANLYLSATGTVNVLGTLNATFYITGVQLEAGTVATPFERKSYGQELALCQRYYYRVIPDNNYTRLSTFGQCLSSIAAAIGVQFPVSMRIKPTSVETTGTANNYAIFNSSGSGISATAITFNTASVHAGEVTVSVASGITAGNATVLFSSNNTTAFLGWSAEL